MQAVQIVWDYPVIESLLQTVLPLLEHGCHNLASTVVTQPAYCY